MKTAPVPSQFSGARVAWVLFALALAYGLYQAISLAWVCDDAFISFRYAKNLVAGHGLVYNVGEVVEGYTNFLWTVVLAAGMSLGLDPVVVSQVLGITAFLLTASVLAYLGLRIQEPSTGRSPIVAPMTGIALLLHHDFQIWATSGLETAAATALVGLGFTLLVLGHSRWSSLSAGFVMILAVLTRPDAMLFYMMAVPYLFLRDRREYRNITYYLIPLFLLYAPYWIIRYAYYGYPFPNTYYAKSVNLSHYSQGLFHLWLYCKTYYVLFLVPVAFAAVLPRLVKPLLRERRLSRYDDRAIVLSLLMIVTYTVFFVRMGGDFMFARFLIPVTPLCIFALEAVAVRFIAQRNVRVVVAFAVIAMVFLRWPQFRPGHTYTRGIAYERAAYPAGTVEQARADGTQLRHYLDGLDVRVGFVGTWAMRMYYADVPAAIECHTGLTDEYIAHLPIEERGRPGHEKHAPMEYLVGRKVNFLFTGGPGEEMESRHLRFISFGGIPAAIIVYDREVMEALTAYPEVEFIEFPTFLDSALQQVESMPADGRREFFDFSREFYFDHNEDPERFRAIQELR